MNLGPTKTPFNYELIYRIRSVQEDLNRASRKRIEAEKAEKVAKSTFKASITSLLGHENFEISNTTCIAEGISYHIYSPTTASSGLGRRHCVCCGCDDFDGF